MDWIMSPLSANEALKGALSVLRGRARELATDNPYIAKYLEEVENNVVGPEGFKFRSRAADVQLDGSEEIDEEACRAIEGGWKKQCHRDNFLVSGDMNKVEADWLLARTVARDGELIIRIVRGYRESEYRFSLQLLEADLLVTEYSDDLQGGNKVRMGVERNSWGRIVAYYFHKEHPGTFSASTSSKWDRIEARDIIHPFITHRINQWRGYSSFAPIMARVKMMAGYEEAEVIAARVGAAKMGFFERAPNAEERYTGDPVNGKDGEDGLYMDASPGSFETLPVGMTMKAFDPQHPTNQFDPFLSKQLRSICSGLGGGNYNTIANDLTGVNYSSLRDGKLTERDQWRKAQRWFTLNVNDLIFEAWLDHCLDFGLLKDARGNALPASKYEKFSKHVFRARRWAWVDPLKDRQANEIDRKNGWTSDRKIVEEQGGDLEETYTEIASDEKLAVELGVELMRGGEPIDTDSTSKENDDE